VPIKEALMRWFVRRQVRAKLTEIRGKAMLSGYRTYIVGCAFVAFGVTGYVTGKLDQNQAVEAVLTGLGFMGLRAAIGNKP